MHFLLKILHFIMERNKMTKGYYYRAIMQTVLAFISWFAKISYWFFQKLIWSLILIGRLGICLAYSWHWHTYWFLYPLRFWLIRKMFGLTFSFLHYYIISYLLKYVIGILHFAWASIVTFYELQIKRFLQSTPLGHK